ncbi:MAG: protoporphyrinogen oxidase [Nocardioides sp.]|uniref:protoporphyrinogen oxidase n=1 Tax=Nocardioides sp. TaxID=35761 RepID=UPI0039E4F7C6
MRVVVVGAGVAGLTAAHELAAGGVEVVVVEASEHLGGKLRLASVAGVTVDVGAEAMLARRPEGVALAASLGIPVVHPTAASSRIWTGGELRPMPPSLMGAPMDLDALEASGILSPPGLAAVRREPDVPRPATPPGADVAVGRLLEERFGAELVDTLVEPLLGGVYAGLAREISLRAAVPQLAAMLDRSEPLTPQLAAVPRGAGGPVFAGIDGGMGLLPARLAAGLEVRVAQPVTALAPTADGSWAVETPGERIVADGVVLATPAWAAAPLLPGDAAVALSRIEHASVAVITHAFRLDDLDGLPALDGSVSGFLVPPTDHRDIKASTFSFAKWDWVRAAGASRGVAHLRTSVGRHRESALDRSDAELVARSLADLRAATGLAAEPVDTHVQRWPSGLPQYAVGHLDLVRSLSQAVEQQPGLVLAGAAYGGVGIPAVIAGARRAAARLLGR